MRKTAKQETSISEAISLQEKDRTESAVSTNLRRGQ